MKPKVTGGDTDIGELIPQERNERSYRVFRIFYMRHDFVQQLIVFAYFVKSYLYNYLFYLNIVIFNIFLYLIFV